IDAFEFEQATGRLTHLQRVSTLRPDSTARSACADIHASGRFLYGSNRGDDSIVVCEIAQANGLLKVRGHVATGGGHPRNFCIDPSDRWLLAANRDSNNVVVFRLDPQSGIPEPHAEFHVPAPVCLLFA
ncbi:MAG: beta-propeller fold lactonase family protein, partial [Pseudomonadales bacterium]